LACSAARATRATRAGTGTSTSTTGRAHATCTGSGRQVSLIAEVHPLDRHIDRSRRDADLAWVVHGDFKAQVPTGRLRGQIILDCLDTLTVELGALVSESVRSGWVIGDILGRLEEDHRIGTWPAPSQVSQVLHTTGSQPARARLEMVIPNGLVKHMPVGHLRSHRSIHFLAGSILIALGIAGIDQVPVGVTPAGDCQASHRADDHYAFA